MCQIAICSNRKPTEQELQEWFSANPDGCGLAWNDGRHVYYVKGLTLLELKEKIQNKKIPFVVHFRLASSGKKDKYLTHPFIISSNLQNPLHYKGREPVLFHNGTYTEAINLFYNFCIMYKKRIPKLLNDSYCIAKLTSILGFNFLRQLTNQKFCIITPTKIIRIGNYTNKEGIFLSSFFFSYGFRTEYYNNQCPYISNYEQCIYKNYTECRFINRECVYQTKLKK